MPRHCSICDHARRHDIDRDLIAGRSCRDIGTEHDLHFRAVDRHRVNHLPHAIRAAAAEAVQRATVGQTAPAPQIAPAPTHGLASSVSDSAHAITPEPASPVRRRQRALQLSDTPPAPPAAPVSQPSTGQAGTTATVAGVLNVYEQSIGLRDRAMALLEAAEAAGDIKTALTAIRESRGVLEHLSRLEERNHAAGPAVPLDQSPEWIRTRAAIISALADHPEARLAVATALVATGALN